MMDDALASSDLRRRQAGWHQAEGRLYPLAMVDPDAYQRAIRLVAGVLDELRRDVHSYDELAVAETRATDIVIGVAESAGVGLGAVAPADVFDAACAMLDRELAQQLLLQRRLSALSAAAEADQGWLDLPGRPQLGERGGIPELRVFVATGAAIHTSIDYDPDTGSTRYLVTPVRVDLVTGDVLGPGTISGEVRTVADPDAWAALAARLGRAIASG
jgi:hypothetical protein